MIEIILRAVIVHDGKILLCLNPKTGTHFLPGGHLEFGETLVEALRREMREEIAREIGEVEILTVIENFYTREGKNLHEINIMARTSVLGGELDEIKALESHVTYAWVALSELPGTAILPEAIKKYVLGVVKG
jgi:ADP-ribose pyrophosphatase YjhB (NUDIX family)